MNLNATMLGTITTVTQESGSTATLTMTYEVKTDGAATAVPAVLGVPGARLKIGDRVFCQQINSQLWIVGLLSPLLDINPSIFQGYPLATVYDIGGNGDVALTSGNYRSLPFGLATDAVYDPNDDSFAAIPDTTDSDASGIWAPGPMNPPFLTASETFEPVYTGWYDLDLSVGFDANSSSGNRQAGLYARIGDPSSGTYNSSTSPSTATSTLRYSPLAISKMGGSPDVSTETTRLHWFGWLHKSFRLMVTARSSVSGISVLSSAYYTRLSAKLTRISQGPYNPNMGTTMGDYLDSLM